MSSDLTALRLVLTQHGYHVTKVRQNLLMVLVGQEPQTMATILQKSAGKIDRVSVYRNIDLFEKLGIVKRIYTGWKYKIELTDTFVPHHHHLSCTICGAVTDIEDEAHIDSFISAVAQKFGFTAQSHQFEIEGVCSSCNGAKTHEKDRLIV